MENQDPVGFFFALPVDSVPYFDAMNVVHPGSVSWDCRRLFRRALGLRPLIVLGPWLLMGCVTNVQPRPQPALSQTAGTEPAMQADPQQGQTSLPPEGRSAQTAPGKESAIPLLPDGMTKLPWVNPARCLPSCAYDPGASLVRVNERGEEDEKGRHRVVRDVREPLQDLLREARSQGHTLKIESAYRSYEDQVRVFSTMKEVGRAARPGHSEHQLGTVIDLRIPTGAAIEWLAFHAADFGFALSYPAQKQRITGYRPEPWHIRFVGKDLARRVRDDKLALEELFRLHPEIGESGTCGDCPSPASHASCGDVPASGRCEKTVLLWCYDGALAAVDCASSAQICGPIGDSLAHDCLPPVSGTQGSP